MLNCAQFSSIGLTERGDDFRETSGHLFEQIGDEDDGFLANLADWMAVGESLEWQLMNRS
jgi:hypothetical protein